MNINQKYKMNKKGGYADILMNNIVYLILLILFFSGMAVFINSKMKGASLAEDYYAKDIVKVIDLSEPGDVVTMDVHRATEVAQDNEADFEEIFYFNNNNNEVCVKLSQGRGSCYSYFNEVDVVNDWIEQGIPGNVLHFSIVETGGS